MSGTALLPPIPLYLSYAANETADAVAAAKGNPESLALIAHFQATGASITSPKQLLADYKTLSVVLGAFGLSSQIKNTAVVRQLLTQDPTSRGSLASQLGSQYVVFAKAFSVWNSGAGTGAGTSPFATAADRASIVSAYQVNNFEASTNAQAPGLQNALYFTREIGNVTSIAQLQSDKTLLDVAVTSAGLPLDDFEELTFSQQTQILTSKIKLADFQNPVLVKRFAEQYIVAQQPNPNTAATTVTPGTELALFGGSDTTANSVLSILQTADGETSSSGTTSTAGSVLSLFA